MARSFAGCGAPPDWYVNLTAYPEVTVKTRRSRGLYRARTLGAEETARLWPKLEGIYPTCAKYRKSRVIRVVELSLITTRGAGKSAEIDPGSEETLAPRLLMKHIRTDDDARGTPHELAHCNVGGSQIL